MIQSIDNQAVTRALIVGGPYTMLCKNMLYTIHHSGKFGMQNIVLFTIGSTKM